MNLNYFLRLNRQFADFTPDELAELERRLMVRRYSDGEIFIREGERGDAMYLLVEGQVLVTRGTEADGAERIICMLGPGDMFGLIALIDRGPRCAGCRAVGEVWAASLPAAEFAALFAAEAPLAHRIQYLIARQLATDLRLYHQALADALIAPDDPVRAYDILGTVSHEYRLPRCTST